MARVRLFVPEFPYPPRGGTAQVAAHQIDAWVQRGHEVELVYWRTPSTKEPSDLFKHPQKIRPLSDNLSSQESVLTRTRRVAASLFGSDVASPEAYAYPPTLVPAFQNLDPEKTDVEIFTYSFAYSWLQKLKGKKGDLKPHRIVYFHNLESELSSMRERETSGLAAYIHRRNTHLLRQHEDTVLDWADEAWFLSRRDHALWCERNPKQRSHPSIKVVPPCYSETIAQLRREAYLREKAQPQLTLGWLGNLSFLPNQKSLTWFLENVAPLLQAQNFQGRLLVGGGGMPHGFKALCERYRFIELLGPVNDLEGFLSRIDAMVVPSDGGSGLQMKLVEAVGSGIPAICNPEALDRLPQEYSTHEGIVTASTPTEWAESLLKTDLRDLRIQLAKKPLPAFLQSTQSDFK